jgi:hypothetical protein
MRRHTACLGRKVEMPKERPITGTEARLGIREFPVSVLLRDVAAFNRRRRDIELAETIRSVWAKSAWACSTVVETNSGAAIQRGGIFTKMTSG